jgi:hypothetical protein
MDQVFKRKRRSLEGASLDGTLSPELAREFLDSERAVTPRNALR